MQSDRYSLRKALQRIFRRRQQKRQRGVRHFEIMESRVLLAADLQTAFQDSPFIEPYGEFSSIVPVTPVAEGESSIAPEGEAAQDLVAFAKALAASGARFYGAAWCPHCTATKELFQDGADFLPFIEVTNLDTPVTLNAVGDGTNTALNPTGRPITSFPTWEFPPTTAFPLGERVEGELTLATISQKSGVPIPSSDLPTIAPIDDGDPASNDKDADGDEIVSLLSGSPLAITIDGYDPGGGPLTYTVTSSNSGVVSASLLPTSRSMVIDVAGWGKMNFRLFEQLAPRPTSRLITLAEAGDYDAGSTPLAAAIANATATSLTVTDASKFPSSTPFEVQIETEMLRVTAVTGNVLTVVRGINGTTAAAHAAAVQVAKVPVPFHRIIDNFVIQGGDITNRNGTGGSRLGDFDDQFNALLQHNRTGVLSFAKSTDDTNNSQFFITEGAQRHLDANHSIAGVLVEGEKNRDAISNNSTTNPRAVTINSVDIVSDTENAVVMLSAAEGSSGSAAVTVTATDMNGNSVSRTFTVNVTPDTIDSFAWLDDITNVQVTAGQTSTKQITAKDVENGNIRFGAIAPAHFTVNLPGAAVAAVSQTATATLSVTPAGGFVGTESITVFAYNPQHSMAPVLNQFGQVVRTVDLSSPTLTLADLEAVSSRVDYQTITAESEASSTTGTVTGVVYIDIDRDGVLDTGESGRAGIVIFSDSNNNGVNDSGEISATTAADGTYSLSLTAGQHRIRQVAAANTALTTDNPVTLTVQSGQTLADVRFGNFSVTAPSVVDLLAATDSGNNSDNITN
ncbi:MAG: peptidylprolyl isomerase, partial [Planctomycetota bacterium]